MTLQILTMVSFPNFAILHTEYLAYCIFCVSGKENSKFLTLPVNKGNSVIKKHALPISSAWIKIT